MSSGVLHSRMIANWISTRLRSAVCTICRVAYTLSVVGLFVCIVLSLVWTWSSNASCVIQIPDKYAIIVDGGIAIILVQHQPHHWPDSCVLDPEQEYWARTSAATYRPVVCTADVFSGSALVAPRMQLEWRERRSDVVIVTDRSSVRSGLGIELGLISTPAHRRDPGSLPFVHALVVPLPHALAFVGAITVVLWSLYWAWSLRYRAVRADGQD